MAIDKTVTDDSKGAYAPVEPLEMWKLCRQLIEFQVGVMNQRLTLAATALGFMFAILGVVASAALKDVHATDKPTQIMLWVAIMVESLIGVLVPWFFSWQILDIHRMNNEVVKRWDEYVKDHAVVGFPSMGYKEEKGIFKMRNMRYVASASWLVPFVFAIYRIVMLARMR